MSSSDLTGARTSRPASGTHRPHGQGGRRHFLQGAGAVGVTGAAWGVLAALGLVPSSAGAQPRQPKSSAIGERGIGACSFDGDPCRIIGNAAATLQVEVADARFYQYVGKRFRLDALFNGAYWAEGPVWLPEQNALVFSDVKANRMYRWSEAKGIQTFRAPSHVAVGNAVDRDGNLITCEHGRRGISRTDPYGERRLLVDQLDGKRFNSPNDVVVRSDGTIWFTDPPYGILADEEAQQPASEIVGSFIYCFDPKSGRLDIASMNILRPNGLAFSPDEKFLYVTDSSAAEFKAHGRAELVVFDVADRQLKNRRVLAAIQPGVPDGLAVDRYGAIYCSCENGLLVLLPDGTELGRLILGKRTTNCCFAAPQTLFITTTNSLYRLRMNP